MKKSVLFLFALAAVALSFVAIADVQTVESQAVSLGQDPTGLVFSDNGIDIAWVTASAAGSLCPIGIYVEPGPGAGCNARCTMKFNQCQNDSRCDIFSCVEARIICNFRCNEGFDP